MNGREEFEKEFPPPDWLVIHDGMYTINPALVGDVTYAVHSSATQQARWEAWQAATQNQDALVAATIKLCAQKCNNIATSNGNSDCTKIAADWCGRVILSLVPEDAQRELDELLIKVAVVVHDESCKTCEFNPLTIDQLKFIIAGVKNDH